VQDALRPIGANLIQVVTSLLQRTSSHWATKGFGFCCVAERSEIFYLPSHCGGHAGQDRAEELREERCVQAVMGLPLAHMEGHW